jgi:hypothetical protein
VRLRREAKVLLDRAVSSLRRSVREFNSFDNDGRSTAVLRDLHHSLEMLLKAALVQRGVSVFDRRTGQSLSFEKCLRLSSEHLHVTADEGGTLRAIDALRNEEQHWFAEVSEGLLYLHARAGVTIFDDLLRRGLGEALADHLPHRVLPISAEPPRDLQLLIDEEFTAVKTLLAPGRRRRPEARARIRTLLAIEALNAEEVRVSKKDVDRVQRGILEGKDRNEVFPRLSTVHSDVDGEGLEIRVRFTRREGDGVPVRLVAADDPGAAAAIREVDLQRKYHRSPKELATALGLTGPMAVAVRRALGIDDDPSCRHVFSFGSQQHQRFSDNAFTRMRDALPDLDLEQVWRDFGPRRRAA